MMTNRLEKMKETLPSRSVFRLLLAIMLSLGALVETFFLPMRTEEDL